MELHPRRPRPGRPGLRRPAAVPAGRLTGPLTVLAVTLAVTLTGCGGSGGGHAQSPSPAGSPNTQQVAALYRRLAQCIRQHGVPNMPDPVQNPTTGEWELPPGTAEPGRAAMEACRSLAEQIPGGNGKAMPAPDMAKLRKFSQCMRDHGLPDWPDPNSEGSFTLPTRLERLGKRGVMAQLEACKQYNVGRGVTTNG